MKSIQNNSLGKKYKVESSNLHKAPSGLIIFGLLFVLGNLGSQTISNLGINAYNLGQSALENDQILEAISYFKQAIAYNPNYADAWRESARAFYYLEESAEAENNILEALARAPQDHTSLTLYGRILITLGRIEDARSIFQQVLSENSYNVEARIGLGELSVAEGNIIQAAEYYQDTLEILPRDHRVLLSLAHIALSQGRENLALQYAIDAFDSKPQDPHVNYYVAELYFLLNNLSKAETYALRAIELQENYYQALELLSHIYVSKKDYQSAIEIFRDIDQQKFIENENLLYTRAVAEYNSSMVEQALQSLNTILRRNPDNEIARLKIEDILIHERNFSDPDRKSHAQYHFTRAREYSERGRVDTARYHFSRGLVLDPFSGEGRQNYASLLRNQGEYAQYLNQVDFIENQLGIVDRQLQDDREIFNSLLANSVSREWDIDQFVTENPSIQMLLFIPSSVTIQDNSNDQLIVQHFMDILVSSSRVEFQVGSGISDQRYEPIRINSLNEGFAISRAYFVDYYIVCNLRENENSIDISASLVHGRTGRTIHNFRVIRSGNTKVVDSLIQLRQEILSALPLQGKILDRIFERAIINLGSNVGIENGQVLQVIKTADLSLNNNRLGFSYSPEDVIGEATVTKVDLNISEVQLESQSFFDNINIGDLVFIPSETLENVQQNSESKTQELNTDLYNRLRQIR